MSLGNSCIMLLFMQMPNKYRGIHRYYLPLFTILLTICLFLLKCYSDDDLYSIHSPIIGESDNDEDEAKHLLPAPSNDLHSLDVPPKLAKDLL